MVLQQLGGSITRALQQMSNATIIDEKVLNECLNEITRALLQSDVQFKLVRDMQTNIKKIVNLDDLAAGHNKRNIIQKVVFYFDVVSCLCFVCILCVKRCIVELSVWFWLNCVCRLFLMSCVRYWIRGSLPLLRRKGNRVWLCLSVYKVLDVRN